MTRKTKICSIFGQIETVVGEAMAAEGKVNMIAADLIPPTMAYDDHGYRASFALVFTPEAEAEFDQRVRALYA
jgi:hypothetical protein